MNDVGMAVDVAHCGERTTLDAFEVSEKPVLMTHTGCRSLMPGHPRCKTDEAIQRMAASGGVMGICFVRNFVRDKEPTTIEHALDHFDYVRKLVGVEYLGVGSDLDLDPRSWTPETLKRLTYGHKNNYAFRDNVLIEGLDHPRRTYDLAEGLIRRGYSDADIESILGGNFKRVLQEIWSI
jgi:membrane dipeptidase